MMDGEKEEKEDNKDKTKECNRFAKSNLVLSKKPTKLTENKNPSTIILALTHQLKIHINKIILPFYLFCIKLVKNKFQANLTYLSNSRHKSSNTLLLTKLSRLSCICMCIHEF